MIAFVFDAMSASGRDMAHKAAFAYLDGQRVEGDQTAVFVLDGGPRLVEPFTRDPARVRAAFDRALKLGNAPAPIDDRADTRDLVDALDRAQVGLPNEGVGTNMKEAVGATAARGAIDQLQIRMTRTFETLERNAGGQSTMNALLAVVNGIGGIPGRKAADPVLRRAPGPGRREAAVPLRRRLGQQGQRERVRDGRGRPAAESETAETRLELEQAAMRRMRQYNEGGGDAPDGDMMRQLERNEDLLRLNPRSGLGELAEATGGFLVPGTNDAGAAFSRIAEDMSFYYLLSYSPTNGAYDGRFRSIEVKVRRPGLQVQARKGYFAVRPSEAAPVMAYEAPAIAALDRDPAPASFPLGVAALTFPESRRHGLVPVIVETPLDSLSCVSTAEQKPGDCAVDFAVVVRIDDAQHREVDRMSQHYRFTSRAGAEEARRQHPLLSRGRPSDRDATPWRPPATTRSLGPPAWRVPI